MALPYAQCWQDWITQAWNIAFGRRAQSPADLWLIGPRGEPGGIGEKIIDQIADREGLTVERESQTIGLVDSFEAFGTRLKGLDPQIVAFYTDTSSYDFDVWTKWEFGWGFFARIVDALFARRLSQLSLPIDPMDTNRGIESEIIALRSSAGSIRHRVWLRKLKSKGSTIYSGFYDHTATPSGEPCMKVVFPLPKGSATVIMRAMTLPNGGLSLQSAGVRDGDPGFYFIVEDRKEALWVHYLKCFHERIDVYVDREGTLRADHVMELWGKRAYSLHYRLKRRANQPPLPTSGLRPAVEDL
jgi:hypothetical protein